MSFPFTSLSFLSHIKECSIEWKSVDSIDYSFLPLSSQPQFHSTSSLSILIPLSFFSDIHSHAYKMLAGHSWIINRATLLIDSVHPHSNFNTNLRHSNSLNMRKSSWSSFSAFIRYSMLLMAYACRRKKGKKEKLQSSSVDCHACVSVFHNNALHSFLFMFFDVLSFHYRDSTDFIAGSYDVNSTASLGVDITKEKS